MPKEPAAVVKQAARGAGAAGRTDLPAEADRGAVVASVDEGEEAPAEVSAAVLEAEVRVAGADA